VQQEEESDGILCFYIIGNDSVMFL